MNFSKLSLKTALVISVTSTSISAAEWIEHPPVVPGHFNKRCVEILETIQDIGRYRRDNPLVAEEVSSRLSELAVRIAMHEEANGYQYIRPQLITAFRNTVNDVLRRLYVRQLGEHEHNLIIRENILRKSQSPSFELEKQELLKRFVQTLRDLAGTEIHREILELRLGGVKISTIAEMMNLPEGTVKSSWSRYLNKVREFFQTTQSLPGIVDIFNETEPLPPPTRAVRDPEEDIGLYPMIYRALEENR